MRISTSSAVKMDIQIIKAKKFFPMHRICSTIWKQLHRNEPARIRIVHIQKRKIKRKSKAK